MNKNVKIIKAITENKIAINIEEMMRKDIQKAEEKRLKELFKISK